MIKLNLLFIAMDLLTLLAYPVIFVYGKINLFIKKRASALLVNSLASALVILDE